LKEKTGEKLIKVNKKWFPIKLSNEETIAELLSRSRYLLFKNPDKWIQYQRERSKVLFDKYLPKALWLLASISFLRFLIYNV
jgi:transposase